MQPLKWVDESDADVKHTAQSALHNYTIQNSEVGKKYEVKYESRRGVKYSPEPATGFATIDDAKTWCWNHYNEKMQPYVVPTQTWIDASKQLPTHHQDVIVYRYSDDEGGSIEHSLYFDGEVMKGFGNVADEDGFFDDVYYWQSIETKALYEAMHMQLQISEVTDD